MASSIALGALQPLPQERPTIFKLLSRAHNNQGMLELSKSNNPDL